MEDKYAYSYSENIPGLHHKFEKSNNTLRCYRTFILELLRLSNCKSYLELGVEFIDNLLEIDIDFCVGVDIRPIESPDKKKVILYNITTDQFFDQNDNTFDIIFIDADHRYEQVKKDFENSLKILNEFGIIMFHDTDPIDKILLSDGYCSDSYKIIDYIRINHPELDIITFPILEAGMSFVMRKKDRRVNKFL